jgi:hypothetical protein
MGRTTCTEPQCLYSRAIPLLPRMGRTACTEPQCLYSRTIPLLPLWAVRPIQSLSTSKRVHFTFTLHDLECVRVKPHADFLKRLIISKMHNLFKSRIATHLQNCWFPLFLFYLRQNIGDNLFPFKTISAQHFAWDIWHYRSEVGEVSRLLSFKYFFPNSPFLPLPKEHVVPPFQGQTVLQHVDLEIKALRPGKRGDVNNNGMSVPIRSESSRFHPLSLVKQSFQQLSPLWTLSDL